MDQYVFVRPRKEGDQFMQPTAAEEVFRTVSCFCDDWVTDKKGRLTYDLSDVNCFRMSLWSSTDARYVRLKSVSRKLAAPEDLSCLRLEAVGDDHAGDHLYLDDEVVVVPKDMRFLAIDNGNGERGPTSVADMVPGTVLRGSSGHGFRVASIRDADSPCYVYYMDTASGRYDAGNMVIMC